MTKCISEKLYNANDFRDVVSNLKKLRDESVVAIKEGTIIPTSKTHIKSSPFCECLYEHFGRACPMNKTVNELQDHFRQLRLSETSEELPQLLREAEKASWTYLEVVEAITRFELEKREAKSIERRIKWARFPLENSLGVQSGGSDRSDGSSVYSIREFSWLEQQYNLILLGPPGVGKTFLAIGLGIEAIQRGFQVYFVTMGELIQLLKTQEFTHKSQVQIKRIQASDLVIIDDLMYMAMDQREANLFSNWSIIFMNEVRLF